MMRFGIARLLIAIAGLTTFCPVATPQSATDLGTAASIGDSSSSSTSDGSASGRSTKGRLDLTYHRPTEKTKLRNYLFDTFGPADFAKNEIPRLPDDSPLKTFAYEPKRLFDKIDTAKLKNQNSLRAAGQFLAANEFGVAVVVVYAGMTGEAQKDRLLTQARAGVIRAYLVENFGFDDMRLKTLGGGKKVDASADSTWGAVEIIVYPAGVRLAPSTVQSFTTTPQ